MVHLHLLPLFEKFINYATPNNKKDNFRTIFDYSTTPSTQYTFTKKQTQ